MRFGLGITFLWIGVLIWRFPESWGGYMQPWALDLLPVAVEKAMLGAAYFDIIIGVLFFIRKFTFIASCLASFHLLMVMIVSGITDITVRDIGLLSSSVALVVASFPNYFKNE